MDIDVRPATSIDDLLLAGSLLSRAWLERAPDVAGTVGDLEWWYAQAWPDELSEHLDLWFVDGDLAGWSWIDLPESGDWFVRPALSGGALEEAILDHLDGRLTGPEIRAWVAATASPSIALLERRGFQPADDALSQYVRRLGADARPLPEPDLPPGYRLRALAGPDELEARLEIHRAAFAPSRMTEGHFRRLATLPHYRFEHDLIAEAPGGSFAAFTLAWWEPVGRVGELEPVGTHPHHRRQGLAKAVILAALRLFADLGAEWAVVFSGTANEASEALYRAAGFEQHTIHRRYVRSVRPTPT